MCSDKCVECSNHVYAGLRLRFVRVNNWYKKWGDLGMFQEKFSRKFKKKIVAGVLEALV